MTEERDAGTVLVVVDDAAVRTAIVTGLEGAAYRPVVASPSEALERLRRGQTRPAVAVVRLERDEGIAFLRSVRHVEPTLGLVSLSLPGNCDLEGFPGLQGITIVDEPFGLPDLLVAVGFQLGSRIRRAAEAGWRRALGDVVAEHTVKLERRMEQFAVASLEVLVTALEARDPFMAGHSQRVAHLSASLCHNLGHSDELVESVRLAGRLHDIGMTVISDRVVNQEGDLSSSERDQVRQHPVVGHQLLQAYPHLWDVARFVRSHHERWDGTGYPDGLAGEEIPWGGRILAVAETYDALVTSRAYRRQVLSPEEAWGVLISLSGKAFDPVVVEAMTSIVGRRQTLEFVLDHTPADQAAEASVAAT